MSPISRGWAFIASFILPGIGLHMIGRPALGWAVLVALLLGFLVWPFAAAFGFILLLLVWLGSAFGPLFVPRGPRPDSQMVWMRAAVGMGFIVVLRVFVRESYVETFKIPSGSMIPTLQVGDHIVVSKFDYGLRVPLVDVVLGRSVPERGEIIAFVYPREKDKDFIKRVVGLPGDRIEVRDDVLYVNDAPVRTAREPWPCEYDDFDERTDRWSHKKASCVEESLDGHVYVVQLEVGDTPRPFPRAGDPSPYVVEPGGLFVLGDNRNNAHDSRFWGQVPLENIKGRARSIWWSQGGKEGVRWGRVGQKIR